MRCEILVIQTQLCTMNMAHQSEVSSVASQRNSSSGSRHAICNKPEITHWQTVTKIHHPSLHIEPIKGPPKKHNIQESATTTNMLLIGFRFIVNNKQFDRQEITSSQNKHMRNITNRMHRTRTLFNIISHYRASASPCGGPQKHGSISPPQCETS